MIQEKRDEEEKTPDAFVQLGLFGYMLYESAGWCRGMTLSAVGGGAVRCGGEKKTSPQPHSLWQWRVTTVAHIRRGERPSRAKFRVCLPRRDLKK